jgi:hypothetical protein
VDLVDEQDIALFQARQQPRELPGLLNYRAAGVFHIHAHRVRDDVRESCFSQAGGPAQQDVLEHIAPLFRRFDQ